MHYNNISRETKNFIDNRRKNYNSFFESKDFSVHKIDGEEVAINISSNGEKVKIVFDGSNSVKEWKSNSDTIKQQSNDIADHENILFHSGFYSTFINILKQLKLLINIDDLKFIDIVGYSRGAVFALFLYRYFKKYKDDVNIIGLGFGMPSCMNETASINCCKKKYTKDFISVEHYQDIVPKILIGWMGYVKTPCKRVMIGSRWAKIFSFWPSIRAHLKYFKDDSY